MPSTRKNDVLGVGGDRFLQVVASRVDPGQRDSRVGNRPSESIDDLNSRQSSIGAVEMKARTVDPDSPDRSERINS